MTHHWKGHPETHPPGDVILVQSKEFQVKKPRGSLFAGVILEFDVPQSRTDLSQITQGRGDTSLTRGGKEEERN